MCEDVVSVRSFSSHSSGNRGSEQNGHTGTRTGPILPKSRIVPKEPETIPLKVYARFVKHYLLLLNFSLRRKFRLGKERVAFNHFQVITEEIETVNKMGILALTLDPSYPSFSRNDFDMIRSTLFLMESSM